MGEKKGMTREEINKKLEKFKSDDEKIKYLESLQERINITKPSTQEAFYGALNDQLGLREEFRAIDENYKPWNFDAGNNKINFWKNAMEYYTKSGNQKALIGIAKHFKFYLRPDLAMEALERSGIGVKKIEEILGSTEDLTAEIEKYGNESKYIKAIDRLKTLKEKNKSKDNPSLENIVHLTGIGGAFLCSLIFLSGGITGNLILNSSVKTSNLLGAGLFIVGVVASFLYTKKK